MEDVWKELSLASLDHHYTTTATAAAAAAANPATRTPVTRLSFQELLSSPRQIHTPPDSTVTTSSTATPKPYQIPNPNDDHCACSKRKVPPRDDDNPAECDRKKYRLMKNRESAARSRARKQAYTSELEAELEHLIEENSKLRKQQEQLYAADQLGYQKQKLQRTLTAPF